MQMVRVDIDEETLSKVAEKTGAQYFRATDTKSLTSIYDEINRMETTTRTIKKFENYRELFSFMAAAALLFLGLELYLRRNQLP
jgi:Ca-activated chloride channel family protein